MWPMMWKFLPCTGLLHEILCLMYIKFENPMHILDRICEVNV
jgi:hypothetical protein